MDLVGRLKKFLDDFNIPNSQFADNCGIPRPTLSQLLNGRNKKVSDEFISKVHANYPNLSIPWLLFGEGSMGENANIEAMEAQNQLSGIINGNQPPIKQSVNTSYSLLDSVQDSQPEKVVDAMFTYFNGSEADFKENKGSIEEQPSSVQIPADPHKHITNIVVFYSDNSFQAFLPSK